MYNKHYCAKKRHETVTRIQTLIIKNEYSRAISKKKSSALVWLAANKCDSDMLLCIPFNVYNSHTLVKNHLHLLDACVKLCIFKSLKHWRITKIAAANMAWTKVRTLLKNHCRLQSNITQECPMVPTVKNMVWYVTRKAPTRSNNQRVRKSQNQSNLKSNGKVGGIISLLFSTYKNLKIHRDNNIIAILPFPIRKW